jgi:hypothetical protein
MTLLTYPLAYPYRGPIHQAVIDARRQPPNKEWPVAFVGFPDHHFVRAQVTEVRDFFDAQHLWRALAERWGELYGQTAQPPWLWLRRELGFVMSDLDATMLAGALYFAAEKGLDLTYFAISRAGWWDPRTGACRDQLRIRREGKLVPLRAFGYCQECTGSLECICSR